MRAYTVATAAVTLRMPGKWLDNVLSHYSVVGVARSRQGVSRRLTPRAIICLEVAIRLTGMLSIPVARALQLANQLLETPSGIPAGKGITLSLDLDAIEEDVAARLAQAVEIAPTPRRGRPARS